ncbi:MAG: hypothetical protein M3044_09105 [Thermoproteota archaeon]|nr:hypothetical protein [Thermoproteota archaeon]
MFISLIFFFLEVVSHCSTARPFTYSRTPLVQARHNTDGKCTGNTTCPSPTPMLTPPPVLKPTPTKPDGSKCHISTNNVSNTCIFIIQKTSHTNSVQQVPQSIFIPGVGSVLPIQCILKTSTQILCNFTMANNNGAVLH